MWSWKSLSCVLLSVTPWTAAHQASLSIAKSRSWPEPMSTELVMPSNHLILCRPLLLLSSNFPSIRVFSSESVLHIRWPKHCSFSFNIRHSITYLINSSSNSNNNVSSIWERKDKHTENFSKKKKKKKLENIQINQPEMRDAKRLGESVTYLDPEGMSLGGSITVQSVCVSDWVFLRGLFTSGWVFLWALFMCGAEPSFGVCSYVRMSLPLGSVHVWG